ncbi:protein HEXIM1 [Hyperolius riggenbachi]|uniref:protein HEXIM1 n=1 Tax=Hyperolius riggenbachi TaxID=752182 RepID=UPI0035A381D9
MYPASKVSPHGPQTFPDFEVPMAEVGVQEPSLPCKSLAGGETLLASQEESGWQPHVKEEEREECLRRNQSSLSCPEEEEDQGTIPECPTLGQLGRGRNPQQEEAWKGAGRKRHRRRPSKKKRFFKPYDMLTWEEKKRLEEKESQRASRMRAEMFAKGQPVAPYNTTQFLMDDHDLEEPDLCPPPRRPPAALPAIHANSSTEEEEEDGTGSDGMGSDDGSEFLQKNFSETYEKYHAESLQDMSKPELIREYMELEKCLSRMEEENNRARSQQDARICELEIELEKLKEENCRLLREREQVVAAGPAGH